MSRGQTVAVSILADAAGVRRGTADGTRSLKGFSTGAMGMLKRLGVAYAAFKGFGLVKDSIGTAIDAVREQDRLLGQTRAVIASTGGAANVTAGQIVKMSDAMERKSLVDAEMIQNGANVLLTFTKVTNAAGKGNDVFNQGTQAALDMSTALKMDMKSSATLVGKALNDPIKGVGALSKSGVQFTEKQKGMIQSLVESGDTLGAQKIILKELNTQFAGSAAAAAKADGGVKRLKDMWDGFVETGVRKVLPLFYRVVDFAGTQLPVAMGKAKPVVDRLQTAFTGAFNAVKPVLTFLGNNLSVVGTFVGVIATVAVVTRTWAVAQGILNAVMAVNPVTLVVLAIAALAAGLVYAYQKSETFRAVVQVAFTAVKAAASALKAAFSATMKAVGAVVRRVGGLISGYIGLYVGAFRRIVSAARAIIGGVKGAFTKVMSTVRELPGKIKNAFNKAKDWLKNAGKDIINGLIKGITAKIGALKDKLKSVTKIIPDWKGPIEKDRVLLRPAGLAIMDGLVDSIEARRRRLIGTMQGITRSIRDTPVAAPRVGFSNAALAGGGRGGRYDVTIRVEAAPGADGVTIGRGIAGYLRDFFDAGGARP